jgi:hypothetical protein
MVLAIFSSGKLEKKRKGLKDVSRARSSWKFIWYSPSVGWKEVN